MHDEVCQRRVRARQDLADCRGASGAIYRWTGMRQFPIKMRRELRNDGDVGDNPVWIKSPGSGHKKHHVLHVVSPLLKHKVLTPAEAIDLLSPCYKALF